MKQPQYLVAIGVIAAMLIGLLLAQNTAHAVPGQPHVFHGKVTNSSNELIGAGYLVEARIGNVHFAQSVDPTTDTYSLTTNTHASSNGLNFGVSVNYQVCADDPGSGSNKEGGASNEAITFYVNGITATIIEINDVTTSQATIGFASGNSDKLHLRIPRLAASKASAATASNDVCKTIEAATPTPTPSPTNTAVVASGGGVPAATATPTAAAAVILLLPTATPTPSPTPSVASVEAATVSEATETIEAATVTAAAEILEEVSSSKAADILEGVTTSKAADILEEITTTKAAEIVEEIETTKAAEIIEDVATAKAAGIIEIITTAKGVAIIEAVTTTKAAAIVEEITLTKAVSILSDVTIAKAADILEKVTTNKAADILEEVTASKSSEILTDITAATAGTIMDSISTERVTDVVKLMDQDSLIERLPEMTTEVMHKIDPQVLFDNLPKVPVEQLVLEVPPELDPTLPAPIAVQVTPSLAVYSVAKTGILTWGKIVGSPSPIDAIIAKFTKNLDDVQITLTDLDSKPDSAPSLDSSLKVNSYFSVDISGTSKTDLAAAHVTIYVEKSWIDANNVHKWSIQFNRLDEDSNEWVPFSTKRIREDDDNAFYTVIVPGFSVIAVTGSELLPVQNFAVENMKISPAAPKEGADVSISVNVTNNGSTASVYPANLWVNNTIEQTQTVTISAGATETVTFKLRRDTGNHNIRIERLIGQFYVGVQPTATPVKAVTYVATTKKEPTITPTRQPVVVQAATSAAPPTATPTSKPVIATAEPTPKSAASTPTSVPATPAPTAVPAKVPTVAPAAVPTATPTIVPVSTEDGGSPVGIIVVVALALVVVAGGILLFLNQRRRNS